MAENIDSSLFPSMRYGQACSFEPFSPKEFPAPAYLDGYFQYLPAVREILPTVRQELLAAFQSFRTDASSQFHITDPATTAFLHCRRGDYVTYEHCGHWLQGSTYYEEALDAILTQAPQIRRILVLSEDTAWCAAQPWATADPRIEIVDCPDELLALGLMSQCEAGAIIGNSTFSWWGAVLGAQRVGAPVIYPRRWLGAKRPNLFFEDWTPAGPPPS